MLKMCTPPPRILGTRGFDVLIRRIICVALVLSLIFLLTGCRKTTKQTVTKVFSETVNNFEWTVEYQCVYKETVDKGATYIYTETSHLSDAIQSIHAENTENDISSPYWEFSARYHGDRNIAIKHTIILKGTYVGNEWFCIEKTESYRMLAKNDTDEAKIKQTYPSCSRYDDKYITLSERTTRYEEKLIFHIPSHKC